MAQIDWTGVLLRCGVRPPAVARWAPHFAAEIGDGQVFSAGRDEIDDFLGQVLHECQMLERLEENLNYSAERLMQVWPRRFPTLESTAAYAHDPARLAEKVYGGRLGNTEPGDGWKYRGSGLIMVTGRANFAALERATGLPLVENPDLLRRPGPECLRVCVAWWEGNVPDGALGDIVRVTQRVNGGTIGLADRRELTDDARDALG